MANVTLVSIFFAAGGVLVPVRVPVPAGYTMPVCVVAFFHGEDFDSIVLFYILIFPRVVSSSCQIIFTSIWSLPSCALLGVVFCC